MYKLEYYNEISVSLLYIQCLIMEKKIQDITYFLSFCIEQYKNAKGLDGAEVTQVFAQYGILDYLNENFEILHTQSKQWIIEDIDEFIEKRKSVII